MRLMFMLCFLLTGVVVAEEPITHSFLVTGGKTYIRTGDGKITWEYPHNTRDGWILPDGGILLTMSKSKDYPSGGIVHLNADKKPVFTFKGSQAEVNTAQLLADGKYMLTEAGNNPRILIINKEGKTEREIKITAQTKDHHLQTRMTRQLPNGHFLVPQLLDRVVREYDETGKIVWEVKTPNMPFTAIRLEDGHTLIGCTHGNMVIEVDRDGKEVWRVSNDDLPGKPIKDACGVQRLPNGNTVFTSYNAGANDVKLTEITRDKKVVWTHKDPTKPGIHHFQIIDTNGKQLTNTTMR